MTGYEAAKAKYETLGCGHRPRDRAVEKVPVSLHCWQLDDVIGFDNDGGLTGGIQTTGNYPGRARTPQQLMEGHGGGNEADAGNGKIKYSCVPCDFETGRICGPRRLRAEAFCKVGGICEEAPYGN